MREVEVTFGVMFASASPLVRCLAAFVVCSISCSGWAETFEERSALAEQGYAASQYNLGRMYYNGEGVLQNYKQAAKWFTKAAEQGMAEAQKMASEMVEAIPKLMGD